MSADLRGPLTHVSGESVLSLSQSSCLSVLMARHGLSQVSDSRDQGRTCNACVTSARRSFTITSAISYWSVGASPESV